MTVRSRFDLSSAIALCAVAALAGCVPAARQTPAPVVTVAPSPIAQAANGPDWQDWPVTPGTWAYRQDGRGSIALFGRAGADAALTLRCDRGAHTMYLSRAGSVTSPLTLRTTSATRALPVRPTGGTPAYVAIAIAPADPLLDAIGFSRGRFVVEQAGAPALVIPPWSEVERVVEDCRA